MGLAEQQRALARIYTDADWREAFRAEPGSLGAGLGLSQAEIDALLARWDDLEYFAATLSQKRWQSALRYFPRSQALLGEALKSHFRAYARAPMPAGSNRHARDALGFLRWLKPRLTAPSRSLRDALGYEIACLRAMLAARGCLLVALRTPVWAPQETWQPGKLTLCLWLRLNPERPWRHLRLPLI